MGIQTDVIRLQLGVTRSGLYADPQQLFWTENNKERKQLSVLRVFTVSNSNIHEEKVAYHDFVPQCSSGNTWQSLLDLRPVMQERIDQEESLGWKTLNVQTVDLPLETSLGTLPENRKVCSVKCEDHQGVYEEIKC